MKCSRDEVRQLEIPTENKFASAAKKTTAAHGGGVRMQRKSCPYSCICGRFFDFLTYMCEEALKERLKRLSYLGAPPVDGDVSLILDARINKLENRVNRINRRHNALRKTLQKDFTNINRARERSEVRYRQVMAAIGIMANQNISQRYNCSMAVTLLFQSYGKKADGKYNVPEGAYPTPKALYQFLRANLTEVISAVEDIVRKPR